MLTLPNLIPYILLILAAITGAFPLLSEIIKKERTRKIIHLVTIFLLIVAAGCAIFDTKQKEIESKKRETEQSIIIQTVTRTLNHVNYTFDSIKSVQKNISQELSLQKGVSIQANLINKETEDVDRKAQKLNVEMDRTLNPVVPIYITIYIEVPLNQHFLDLINQRALNVRIQIKKRRDSLHVDKLGKNGRPIAYLDVDTNLFDLPLSSKSMSEVEKHEYSDYILDNHIAFSKGKKIKDYFREDRTLFPEMDVKSGGQVISQKIQVDFYEKKYLIKLTYLVDSFSGGYINPKHFGFDDFANCNFTFWNGMLNYNLRLVELRTKQGIVNNCSIAFSEKNVSRQYSYINNTLTSKEYKYHLTSKNLSTASMWPF